MSEAKTFKEQLEEEMESARHTLEVMQQYLEEGNIEMASAHGSVQFEDIWANLQDLAEAISNEDDDDQEEDFDEEDEVYLT